jgi:hypothetical protein
MKRTLKYALTAVLGTVIIAPAMAQSNFPDVPETHWAYKELATLKANGLLVGYPDGLFRGGRPASRYEMAVAIHAAWSNLKGITDGLKTQIDELMAKLENAPSKADVDNLKAALEALQNEVNRIKAEDIASLRRLVDELSAELKALGANVDVMKKDIADLQDRVGKLEKKALPFNVTGDINFVVLGGYSGNRREFGVSLDGRPLGRGKTPGYAGAAVGVSRDLTVLHEAGITLTSNNETGPKFKSTFVVGNTFGAGSQTIGSTAFRNQSQTAVGASFGEGRNDIYFQEFNVNFDTNVAGLGFNAEVGRIGYQISPYLFKRADTTPYYANDRWDNGNWMIDGALLGFNFGSTKFHTVVGRVGTQEDTNGRVLQPLLAGAPFSPFQFAGRPAGTGGALNINTMLGLRINTPLGENGALNLAYLWLDSDRVFAAGRLHNGVDVYGADVNFKFAENFTFTGAYSKSDIRNGNRRTVKKHNEAWDLGLAYDTDRFGLSAAYRYLGARFYAPGDWGRIGYWYNPTDIEGFKATGYFGLAENLKLNASAEFYEGTGKIAGGFRSRDKINRYTIGLDYKWLENANVMLGYERVEWRVAGNDPRENWFNIGVGANLDDRTKFSFLWQISDYDAKRNAFYALPWGGNRGRGGLFTTQLSVKF